MSGAPAPGRTADRGFPVQAAIDAASRRIISTNPFTYSIAVVASTDFCIRNNTTSVSTSGRYDQLDGIHILDSSYGVVQANRGDQGSGADGDDGLVAHSMGEPIHHVAYVDNEVRGGRHGTALQIAVAGHGAHHLRIAGNRFWGSTGGVRTGYYGGAGAVTDIDLVDNVFEDNKGPSVDLYGNLSGIRLSGNTACRSGGFSVVSGFGSRLDPQRYSC